MTVEDIRSRPAPPVPAAIARNDPPRALPRRSTEIFAILLLYAVYDLTRNLRQSSYTTASHHGWAILRWERVHHLAPEHLLNHALASVPPIAVLAGYFYASLHFVVTPGVLAWMYRRHGAHYRQARSTLMLATGTALIGFWLLPTAPPRLLAHSGIRDTLDDVHRWGWWSGTSSAPHGLAGLANEYAAMPSLHAAWALWAGWLLFRHARSSAARFAGAAYPVLTALVVMGTGNHYLLDVVAGAAVTIGAAAVVSWSSSRTSRLRWRC